MENSIKKYKWRGLIAFCFVYNIVYLGRFNINYQIENITENISINAGQERILLSSIFISYAIGSLLNGPLADRIGAKKIIFIGGIGTALMNILVYYSYSWSKLLFIWFLNGYLQSMIWIGGVVLVAKWWKGSELGMSIGLANFASGLSHVTAYLVPIAIIAIWPGLDWKVNFVIPMGILVFFLVLFELLAVEAPQKEKKEEETGPKNPWFTMVKKKGFIVWCFIAALSSICRYGLLNWIPLYYKNEVAEDVSISETFLNLTLPMGMAFGTLIITWIAGVKFQKNYGLIITALAASCGTLVVIFPMVHDSQAILIGIFMTGFALYGINGILWLYAIEAGKGRNMAGTAAGILNASAYIGAGLESVVFPALIGIIPSYMIIFVVIEIFCIAMVLCGIIISRKDTNVINN